MNSRYLKGLSRFLATLAAVALAGVVLVGTAQPAFAEDKVLLKDGRVLEGEIVREINGSIWLSYTVGGVEQKGFFTADQIESIERDVSRPAATAAPVKAEAGTTPKPRRSGAPRAVVLTLEGMVGMEFAAKPLHEAIAMLEKELGPAEDGERLVVFKINSGGGMLLEIERLQDVIEQEFKPRFRTVAWIESAISAAAMTSHVIEEVYFMPQGNYGACVGFFGATLVGVKGRGLEEVLYLMEKASAKGQWDFQIMRSMQIDDPLSANIDAEGNVTWYNTEEGEYLVNPAGRILTFNASTAEKFKFSTGTATTIDELALLLGYEEIDWIGKDVPGSLFPISKAEQHQIDWRKSVSSTNKRFGEYYAKYQISVANAQAAQDRTERGMFVGAARRELNIIERACRDHPNIKMMNGIPDGWFEDQHQLLRDLMKLP